MRGARLLKSSFFIASQNSQNYHLSFHFRHVLAADLSTSIQIEHFCKRSIQSLIQQIRTSRRSLTSLPLIYTPFHSKNSYIELKEHDEMHSLDTWYYTGRLVAIPSAEPNDLMAHTCVLLRLN